GTAAIEFVRAHGLVERAACLGNRMLEGLRIRIGSNLLVRDIRGRGLMLGIETISNKVARALRAACLSRGLIIELGGREGAVLRLLPPLVLTDGQAEKILDILEEAMSDEMVERMAL
ncbi:MAG TPA: aminotransferase class III-fold pyridoxal phosphate-dependent enzyme, partial [Chthonomonadaceae bacterium]|nr:aminotransferase class III-fold pyridoxal phosphate-dependent enzyme [Chthonomonadaceae bacterium]